MDAPQLKPAKRPNYRERVRLGLVKAKPRKRIKPVSDKKKDALDEYIRWSRSVLSVQKNCQRCGQDKFGLEAHHPHGRHGSNLFVVFALCQPCHTWVHEMPNTALAHGWLSPEYRGLKHDPEFKLAATPIAKP